MASVTITCLEMHSPAALRRKCNPDKRFWIAEATVRQWQFNRFLYAAVGADWSWTDKRSWTDQQWRDYVDSPDLRTFGAYFEGAPAGFFELRHTPDNEVEIAYFGLLPAFIGRGFGGALLTRALDEAWQMSPKRVWVHTCTLDHPSALANYIARGMVIYKVESRE